MALLLIVALGVYCAKTHKSSKGKNLRLCAPASGAAERAGGGGGGVRGGQGGSRPQADAGDQCGRASARSAPEDEALRAVNTQKEAQTDL